MRTNTKTLFSTLVKRLEADCICDIGSRDGKQSLLFRHLRPSARVLAFEANPNNAKRMAAEAELQAGKIEIHAIAIADQEGSLDFHLSQEEALTPETEVNYGSSSLLARTGRAAQEFKSRGVTKVPARRLDDVLRENCPEAKRIALWIDAEGAEYMILQGIAGCVDRIYVLHIETAVRPVFEGQRLLPELEAYLKPFGFVLCGGNIPEEAGWGDAVFVRKAWADQQGFQFALARWQAQFLQWAGVDTIAVTLKQKWPWLYRTLRACYVKFT